MDSWLELAVAACDHAGLEYGSIEAFWTFTGVWHGTFTRDQEAMRACLRTLFAEHHSPERFARRCLAALLHTPSMSLVWPYFVARENGSKDIVRDMPEYFYPPDVFGPPD